MRTLGRASCLAMALLAGACDRPAEPPAPLAAPAPGGAGGSVEIASPRFVDVAARCGLTTAQIGGGPDVDYIIESLGAGGAWLDYDLDGDPDLYLVQGALPGSPDQGPPDLLYRNDGDADGDGLPLFVEVGQAAGLGDRRWGFAAAVADYDGDGDPDLHLANWGADRLYRNNGDGTFTDVAPAAGLADPGWSVSSVWTDVDRDGDPDLYVTRYVEFDFRRYPARGERSAQGGPPCVWKGVEVYCGPRNLEAQPDRFYRNDGDPDGDGVPRFVEVTGAAGLATGSPHFGLAVHAFDADGDGDDDLYVANDSVQNSFFVNRGDGTFDESAIFAGLAYNEAGNEQAGMGVASADYDRDGDLDLAVTNFSHDHDTLYRNDGDLLFLDRSYPAGIGSPSFLTLAWGLRFLDLDHDGWEDLVIAHGHVYPQVDGRGLGTSFAQPNDVFRNRGDGTFVRWTESLGPGFADARSSRALLPVDLEGDGDIDLLFTALNEPPQLLLHPGAPGHWLQVSLRGTASNRDGLGARITIDSEGGRQVREIRGDSGYAGSTLPVAHFGLGSDERVARLEVRWPSGSVTTLDGVSVDRRLTLVEGE